MKLEFFTTLFFFCFSLHETAKLGDLCLNTAECEINTVCDERNNVCQCEPGYSEYEEACARLLGDPCDMNKDCVTNTECDGRTKICQCKAGFFPFEWRCARNFGDRCSNNQECATNGECDDSKKICQCTAGFLPIDERCVKHLGEHCSSSQECVTNGECDYPKMICQCTAGFYPFEERCVKHLGDKCTKIEVECYQIIGEKNVLECSNKGECTCIDGFQNDKANEKCIEKVIQCDPECGANAHCDNEFCKCPAGYHGDPNVKCIKDKSEAALSFTIIGFVITGRL